MSRMDPGMHSIAHHLTDQALRPIERVLLTIRACNRALVRAADEPDLLREICRVAVEQGGYRMAWVGYPQADETKSVVVAASAGHEAGYLDDIKISWDGNRAEGRGPCGTAIRTGQVAIFNNHSTDPNYQPWRAAAAARGYAASVGLPLLEGSRCFGVFSIYAAEANAFDAAEVDMLKELASDLAFGVLALRLREDNQQAERALAKAHAHYQNLLHVAADGIHILEMDGRLIEASPSFYRMLEYDPDNPPPLKVEDWDAQWPIETLRQQFAQLIRHPGIFETRHRRKNGAIFPVEIHAQAIELDGRSCLYASSRDISERKEAENQLFAERNLLHALMDNLPDAIYFKDTESRFTRVNLAQAKNLGAKRIEEVIGKTDADFIPLAEARQRLADEHRLMTTGEPIVGAVETWGDEKSPRWLSATKVPIRDAGGKITGLIGVTRDITEYKWAELERQRLDKRLLQAQKMEAIGTLAGGIAHDFNNILAAMAGYSYLLQQDTQGNAVAQENIGEILKAMERAKELVQQILVFSRHQEPKPQIIRLEMVIKEAIKFLRASLPAQIRIQLDLSEEAPSVLADPTSIYQVVINLATNALHAMENQSGQLTVSLAAFTPDAYFIHEHPEFKSIPYACLAVTDTGHGMDAHTKDHIFEPFFTTKPVGKGTGLGLAVVHGILQSLSGLVTVESELGKGACFRLYFPAQIQPAGPPEPAAAPLPMGCGQRILLVDDELPLTKTLQQILSRLNYQVIASNSAPEACALFRQNPAQFDVVVTDLSMPEMNGLELARQIHACHPEIPVILTSGFAAEVTADRLASSDIYEVLEKPVAMTALAETLHRLFTHS